jgi:hypothetical protein
MRERVKEREEETWEGQIDEEAAAEIKTSREERTVKDISFFCGGHGAMPISSLL